MKRNVLVGVRFSPEEHAYLCEQAEKDVETQKRNGTNINQATKQLHIGYEPMAAVSRLQKNMNVLERQLEEMKEEFKQIYGNHKNIKH